MRDTHESRTDREARLYKKSAAGEARPSYLGHLVIENRNGLVVAAGHALQHQRRARSGAGMLDLGRSAGGPARRRSRWEPTRCTRRNLSGVAGAESDPARGRVRAQSQVAELADRAGTVERRLPLSQKKRKLVEKVFGWAKLNRILRQVKYADASE